MAPTVDANMGKYRKLLENGYKRVLKGKDKGEVVLKKLGMRVTSDIKKAIRTITDPPLSDSTVENRRRRLKTARRKPSVAIDKPLIDSTHMLKSVDYVVTRKWRPAK